MTSERRQAAVGDLVRWVEGAVSIVSAATGDVVENDVRVLLVSDVGPGDPAWLRALVRRFPRRGTRKCAHLRRRRGQTGVVFVEEGFARCVRCLAEFLLASEGPPAMTCAGCGGQYAAEGLAALCVEARPWVLCSAVCVACRLVLRAGGES